MRRLSLVRTCARLEAWRERASDQYFGGAYLIGTRCACARRGRPGMRRGPTAAARRLLRNTRFSTLERELRREDRLVIGRNGNGERGQLVHADTGPRYAGQESLEEADG